MAKRRLVWQALTDVAVQVFLPICLGDITADLLLAVVLLVHRLSDQVQAVQLVEYLDTGSVTPFPCNWVLDLERLGREAKFDSFFLCDHDIANCHSCQQPCVFLSSVGYD